MFRISIFISIFLSCLAVNAQDIEYVQRQAETLSSYKMRGRGYVKNGVKKASKYIVKEYEKIGLKKLNGSYIQELSYPVNTYPYKLKLTVNGSGLIAGRDYQIGMGSGSSKGEYTVVMIDKNKLSKLPKAEAQSQYIIAIDPIGITDKDSIYALHQLLDTYLEYGPVIWLNNEKLTWSISSENKANAILEIKSGLIKEGDKIDIKIRNKYISNYKSNNILGYVEGSQYPDSFMVFTAHYDHLGMMGKNACYYGANDNASGVAFILSLAKYYVQSPSKYSILFIAFTGEEAGLVGSKYYTEHPVIALNKMKFLINMDLLGYGEDGIAIVNATLHEKEYEYISDLNENGELFKKIKKRGAAANSDHYWFEEKGVPSFFIYTMGGNQAYHDVYDGYQNLSFFEYNDLFGLLVNFLNKL